MYIADPNSSQLLQVRGAEDRNGAPQFATNQYQAHDQNRRDREQVLLKSDDIRVGTRQLKTNESAEEGEIRAGIGNNIKSALGHHGRNDLQLQFTSPGTNMTSED